MAAKEKTQEGYPIYKPEEDKLVIKGALTAFRHGVNRFDKDTEKYYISVRTTALPEEIRQAILSKYFEDTKEKYIPEPLKSDQKDPDKCYFNLKSLYEIPVFMEGKGNEKYTYEDVIDKLGDGLPPYGSEVILSCRLKEGAIYPLACKFVTIQKASADDYFD